MHAYISGKSHKSIDLISIRTQRTSKVLLWVKTEKLYRRDL